MELRVSQMWGLDLNCDWPEWFQAGYNWRNFHFFELSYEDECHMGQREIVGYLLGFGFRLHWCYDDQAEGMLICKKGIEEIEARIAETVKESPDQLSE